MYIFGHAFLMNQLNEHLKLLPKVHSLWLHENVNQGFNIYCSTSEINLLLACSFLGYNVNWIIPAYRILLSYNSLVLSPFPFQIITASNVFWFGWIWCWTFLCLGDSRKQKLNQLQTAREEDTKSDISYKYTNYKTRWDSQTMYVNN